MTNTFVLIRDELGLRVPTVFEVVATDGASITLKADEGAASLLYFPPDTAAILGSAGSPVELKAGTEVTYTFTNVGHGSYGVIAQAPGDPAPDGYDFGPPAVPAVLAVLAGKGGGGDFPTPTNTPDTFTSSDDSDDSSDS